MKSYSTSSGVSLPGGEGMLPPSPPEPSAAEASGRCPRATHLVPAPSSGMDTGRSLARTPPASLFGEQIIMSCQDGPSPFWVLPPSQVSAPAQSPHSHPQQNRRLNRRQETERPPPELILPHAANRAQAQSCFRTERHWAASLGSPSGGSSAANTPEPDGKVVPLLSEPQFAPLADRHSREECSLTCGG